MKIENTSRIPTNELKPILAQVLRSAPLGKARTYLHGKDGLYVTIHNAKYSQVRGRIYPDAIQIHRQGKEIPVRGYIKLFVFPQTSLEQLATTFAHELSHFKDWYDHCTIFDTGYVARSKIPRGREKRARAFADKVITRINKQGKENKNDHCGAKANR
jgi:hypothetical protein